MTNKLTLTILLALSVLSTGSAQEYMTLSDAIRTARKGRSLTAGASMFVANRNVVAMPKLSFGINF